MVFGVLWAPKTVGNLFRHHSDLNKISNIMAMV